MEGPTQHPLKKGATIERYCWAVVNKGLNTQFSAALQLLSDGKACLTGVQEKERKKRKM